MVAMCRRIFQRYRASVMHGVASQFAGHKATPLIVRGIPRIYVLLVARACKRQTGLQS